jgi:hypothetical protein
MLCVAGNTAQCRTCGKDIPEEDIVMHKVKAHGDVSAVQYLNEEKKEGMLKKVIVRNLYLSGIPVDMIALQVDMDTPSVLKIISEVSTWVV